MHTCIHAYVHTCIHAYVHTCIHAYMRYIHALHTYIYILYMLYICMYTYNHWPFIVTVDMYITYIIMGERSMVAKAQSIRGMILPVWPWMDCFWCRKALDKPILGDGCGQDQTPILWVRPYPMFYALPCSYSPIHHLIFYAKKNDSWPSSVRSRLQKEEFSLCFHLLKFGIHWFIRSLEKFFSHFNLPIYPSHGTTWHSR